MALEHYSGRYVDKDSKRSTKEALAYAKKLFEQRQQLLETIGEENIPKRKTLNMETYTVQKTPGDARGLLAILEREIKPGPLFKGEGAQNRAMRQFCYAHIMNQTNAELDPRDDLNVIEPGDQISVTNGVLTVKRAADGHLISQIDLYEWNDVISKTVTLPAPE